jgi:small subunit ribosomal protein S3
MAQKTKPNTLRLGMTVPWSSRWFTTNRKLTGFFLEEDQLIRKIIKEKVLVAGIASIEIERTNEVIRITIRAGRPGLIIGRGGKGIEDLRETILKAIRKLREKNKMSSKISLNINVEELKRTEASAPIVAQQIAFDIEKRQPYRRVIKRQLEALMQNREVKGVKIKVAGRLNGAEISRRDWLAAGKMPLQNLRANIDYGEATAFNSYGTVGVKVWIYKGEIFRETNNK